MNKKGFTLIELLGVITILAVIATVSYYTINGVTESFHNSMWKNQIDLIENAAVRWGEDNEYILVANNNTSSNPITVTVDTLIIRGYLSTDERDGDRKIITKEVNGVKKEVNNTVVKVWYEGNEINDIKTIYASYVDSE